MSISFNIRSINDYSEVNKQVDQDLDRRKIIALNGTLGAGKTAFVKQYIETIAPGLDNHVSSPSFGIVNEYQTENKVIYHFDLYRVKDEVELEEFGFQEYLHHGDIIFIEWPADFTAALPKEQVQWLTFELIEGSERKVTITYP